MDDWTSFGAAPAQNNKTNNYGNNNPNHDGDGNSPKRRINPTHHFLTATSFLRNLGWIPESEALPLLSKIYKKMLPKERNGVI
jgi:hypothetical protein